MYFIMQNSRSLKEAFDSLPQVKLCIGQQKYKQKFTTQGRIDRPIDQAIEFDSLTK